MKRTCGGNNSSQPQFSGGGGGMLMDDSGQEYNPNKRVSHLQDFGKLSIAESETTVTKVHASSIERDYNTYPNSTQFNIPVYNPNAQILKSVELISISMPMAIYNINSTNDRLYISEVSQIRTMEFTGSNVIDYPSLFELKVPHGNYEIADLVDMLNSLASSWVYVKPSEEDAPQFEMTTLMPAFKRLVKNTYVFSYSLVPTARIIFSRQVTEPENPSTLDSSATFTNPYDVYIHCPALNTGFTQTNSSNYGGMIQSKEIRILHAYCPSDHLLVLQLQNTSHNITKASIAEVIQLRNRTDGIHTTSTATLSLYMKLLPSYTNTPSRRSMVVYVYTRDIKTRMENTFPEILDTSRTTVIEGFIKMYHSNGNLWPALGFTRSNDDLQYTPVPVLSISPENHTDRATHTITTAFHTVATTNIRFGGTFNSAKTNLSTSTGYTLAAGTSVGPSSFQIAAADITFTDYLGSQPQSDWVTYCHGHFIGDRVFDLRANSVVIMRLKLNGRYVGEFNLSAYNDNGQLRLINSSNPLFSVFCVENVAYGEVFQINREINGYLGKYSFQDNQLIPLRQNELVGDMVVELLSSDGEPLDLDGLNWACAFEFVFGYPNRSQKLP